MTIRQRILMLVALSFAALLVVGGYAVYRSVDSEVEVRRVTEGVVPTTIDSVSLMGQLKDVQIAVLDMVAAPDTETLKQKWDELRERKGALERAIKAQEEKADSQAQKGLVKEVEESLKNYFSAIDDTAKFRLAGQKALAEANLAATVEQYLREQGQIIGTLQVEKTRSKDEAIVNLNDSLASTVSGLTTLSLVAIIGLALLGWLLYRQIVLPIGVMQRKMTEIATSQDYSHRLEVDRQDEIGQSMRAFNVMIEKIEESAELVRQKSADIHAMLHAVPQGILTLEAGGIIHPEYSEFLAEILETRDIAGRDIFDVLFRKCSMGSDLLSQTDAAIAACLGEDQMNYEFNSHVLPTEVEFSMPDGRSKVLDLHWAPIANEHEIVERILLVIRDVTEIRALEREAKAQKRELNIIGEILAVRHEKFQDFVSSSRQFLAENEQILAGRGEQLDSGSSRLEDLARLFRNMHTIKGNARTHGLLHLTNSVHEAEQTYDRLRKDPVSEWPAMQLRAELEAVQKLVQEYEHISEVKLGRKGPGRRADPDRYLMVPREAVDQLNHFVQELRSRPMAGDMARIEAVHSLLNKAASDSMADILKPVIDSLDSLAQELAKAPPTCVLDDGGLRIRKQAVETIRNVFPHLYRNSLDHGIEPPAERLAAGKPAAGRIELRMGLSGEKLRIEMRDDGRGLNLARIREKAIEAGLIREGEAQTDESVAQLIFHSGLSTAGRVTEVSGRGVGMDAVKAFLESLGGTIDLRLVGAKEGDGLRPFVVDISLPAHLAMGGATS